MTFNVLLEGLFKDIGGCGKFQWLLAILVHMSKTISTWTMIHMTFFGQEPGFLCTNNLYKNSGSLDNNTLFDHTCTVTNLSDCTSFRYDGTMHTVVSQVSFVTLFGNRRLLCFSENVYLRRADIFSVETSVSKSICILYGKVSTLKG